MGQPEITESVRVEVDESPVYEALLGLFASSRPQDLLIYETDGPLAKPPATGSPWLTSAIERLGGRYCEWDQLVGFAAGLPPPRTMPRFLEAIRHTEPIELLVHVLGFYAERIPPHVRAMLVDALDGSRSARSTLLRALSPYDVERQQAISRVLDLSPVEVRGLIATSVERWYDEMVRPTEPAVAPLLAADASAKRALLTSAPELIIRVSTGVRYVPKPWIESVLLIPNTVLDPWLVAIDYKRMRIYCYAIAEDAPDVASQPPPATIRLYRALANATRLKIIKSLAGHPMTVQQLSAELEIAEPDLRPHLAILRDARLVGIICSDQATYEVRGEMLSAGGPPLRAYLDTAPGR